MSISSKQTVLWKNKNSAHHYWNSKRPKKRREWFINSLGSIRFASIYEVGCNSGRNLWAVTQTYPDKLVGGIDINEEAIDMARNKMPQGAFEVGDIHTLNTDDEFDVVFTSGVLLHISPNSIKKVLSLCISKAKKYVLHMETYGVDKVINGPAHMNPTKKVSKKLRCIHNYARLYEELGYSAKIGKIPHAEKDAAHIIIVKLT